MTATVSRHPDNENIISVGNNFRIESGPPRITDVATEELLHNDNTAEHYFAPYKDEQERTVFAKDADGNPIRLGEEFTYLDWGGKEREGKRVFYIYEKTKVDPDNEFDNKGERNLYYVPKEARDKDTNDRTFYDYIWKEVATRATEEAAIEFAQRNAAD